MEDIIYQDNLIKVEIEHFEIPWVKIFTQEVIKEFSFCDEKLQFHILKAINIIEKEMLNYFKCDKINISSFGNHVPHVHFHIQGRFKNDSYFPQPTWGEKQRESILQISDKSLNIFYDTIALQLKEKDD